MLNSYLVFQEDDLLLLASFLTISIMCVKLSNVTLFCLYNNNIISSSLLFTDMLQKSITKLTALDYCNSIYSLDGCSTKCAKAVHHLSEADIWMTHQRFAALGSFQQRQWILNYLHSNSLLEEKETIFLVSGKSVCLAVWLATLGLSRTRYYEVRKAFVVELCRSRESSLLPQSICQSHAKQLHGCNTTLIKLEIECQIEWLFIFLHS